MPKDKETIHTKFPVPTGKAGEPLMAQALVERRLAGERVRLDKEIDRGGMGLIERVQDLHLGRTMARKVLAPRLAHDLKSVKYFMREAWITARLAHPAVVPVHELSRDEQGRLNFVMKLVDGEHLGRRVAALEGRALKDDELFEFLSVIVRICEALELAHTKGIIHRDLKPDNVMVGAFGAVYLMDWGVAYACPVKAGMPLELQLDDAGTAVGTPAYMAPEQAMGTQPDARTDVYGVGGLIYYMLTRRPPHEGRAVLEVLQAAAYDSVRPPSARCPHMAMPRALESIVMRAMSSDPNDRYESVAALSKALRRFMRGGGDFPRKRVEKGEEIVREGESGDAAFIIASGRFEVFQMRGGERKVLREMGAGEVFGEVAILGSGLRTASVVACETSELLVVTRETLEREVSDMKPWVGSIVRSLVQRFETREAGSSDE